MILWQKQASAKWLTLNEPRLQEIAGCDLVIIGRPGRVRALVQVTCRRGKKSAELLRAFGGRTKTLPLNWLSLVRSRQIHPPIRIGRSLVVVSESPGSPMSPDKTQLIIPAAGAFGTGEHATTAMSLRLLEEFARHRPPGWRLLDAGTGTGILALAARRLGGGDVLGLDIDPRAVTHARQNARLNRISKAKFIAADVLRWKSRARYEIVTANLFSGLLVAALPKFQRALTPNGCLIVSGILREQAKSVLGALRLAGFRLEKQRRRGKWIALRCTL